MTEIVGGLNIKEVAEGGTVFELKYDDSPKEDDITEEKNCTEALQNYLKLECLDVNDSYDGDEPFQNIAKEMHNLLQNGKIKKRIIREGYGLKPELFTNVMIHYNAYVQYEAQPFDSTYARKKSFCFIAGEGQVIEGLEIAVLSMRLNEKSQFLIDPELAYRNSGLNRIPPNSVVLFEIELCEIFLVMARLCEPIKLRELTEEGIVFQVDSNNVRDHDSSSDEDNTPDLLEGNLQYFNKECVGVFDEDDYQEAKVYFNHAKCLRILSEYDNAKAILDKAYKLEPRNLEIANEIFNLENDKLEHKKKQKIFAKALVGNN
ncbi:hypothetical protein MTP99_007844 [Tenebrio molitor]|nr:hypothetical protein MTP99_007844 [Tenebrio molitor]